MEKKPTVPVRAPLRIFLQRLFSMLASSRLEEKSSQHDVITNISSKIDWKQLQQYRDEKLKQHNPTPDPHEFLIAQDHWMINRPADKACYEYIAAFQDGRNQKAIALAYLYAAAVSPILPLVLFLTNKLFHVVMVIKKLKKGGSSL